MSLFFNNKKFSKKYFKLESEFENLICENAKRLFGDKSIYIDSKKKINSGELGKTIPDGLLFDFSEKDDPKFYLVEIELSKHRFYDHIFSQITKFFAFLRDGNSFQSELIDFLYRFISSDVLLLKEFRAHLGEEELFKFLKDVVENSTDILILIDDLKSEFKEIKETYTDTWDKHVRILCVNSFVCENQTIIQINPDFEVIKDVIEIDSEDESEIKPAKYTEEYHLEGINPEIKEIYSIIKSNFQNFNVNPQHYYISLRGKHNFVFIQLRKSKIKLVIMLPIERLQKMLTHYKATEPSLSVQRFYNGKCSAINIDNKENLNEIIKVLEEASISERIKIPRDSS